MAVMFMKIDTNCDGTVDWVSIGYTSWCAIIIWDAPALIDVGRVLYLHVAGVSGEGRDGGREVTPLPVPPQGEHWLS